MASGQGKPVSNVASPTHLEASGNVKTEVSSAFNDPANADHKASGLIGVGAGVEQPPSMSAQATAGWLSTHHRSSSGHDFLDDYLHGEWPNNDLASDALSGDAPWEREQWGLDDPFQWPVQDGASAFQDVPAVPSSDPFPALELKQPEAMATEMLTGPTAPAGTTGPSAPLGAFHHEFTDMDAALAATYAHLDLGAVRVDDPTYPTTNEHHQQYVERLSLAIADVSNTRDLPPGSPPPNGKVPQAYGKFADGKYSARQIQGLAWEILNKAKMKPSSGSIVPLWQRNRKAATFGSFEEHMAAICEVLASQKTICKRLLDPPFVDEMVDHPNAQLQRAAQNKRLNTNKARQIRKGREALSTEEPTPESTPKKRKFTPVTPVRQTTSKLGGSQERKGSAETATATATPGIAHAGSVTANGGQEAVTASPQETAVTQPPGFLLTWQPTPDDWLRGLGLINADSVARRAMEFQLVQYIENPTRMGQIVSVPLPGVGSNIALLNSYVVDLNNSETTQVHYTAHPILSRLGPARQELHAWTRAVGELNIDPVLRSTPASARGALAGLQTRVTGTAQLGTSPTITGPLTPRVAAAAAPSKEAAGENLAPAGSGKQ